MKLARSILRRRSVIKGLACGQAGFTLIEVVIVTVIIGILTAIAIPSYTEYIRRSNRSDARAQLLMASQWMERVRNESGRYDFMDSLATVPVALPAALQQSPVTGAARYNVALGNLAPGTYTLTATAVGTMAGDPCTTMTVTQTGVRNFTTGGGGSMVLCWGR
jgi:type IV pilus assembly protein PilE